jgi:hypothetical protein
MQRGGALLNQFGVGNARRLFNLTRMSKLRIVIIAGVLAIILALGLGAGFLVGRLMGLVPTRRTVSTATLLTQVQGLAQFVTVKYVMEKVVVVEDVNIYGENRVLLIAHGIVKAGVDLSKLRAGDLKAKGAKIRVTLPQAAITDVYLDDQKTQVLEHKTGLLRRFDKDLQQSARVQGLDEIRRAARNSGILDDASDRARQQLTFMFHQLGFQEIEFEKP